MVSSSVPSSNVSFSCEMRVGDVNSTPFHTVNTMLDGLADIHRSMPRQQRASTSLDSVAKHRIESHRTASHHDVFFPSAPASSPSFFFLSYAPTVASSSAIVAARTIRQPTPPSSGRRSPLERIGKCHGRTVSLLADLVRLELHPRPVHDLVREDGEQQHLGDGPGKHLVELGLRRRSIQPSAFSLFPLVYVCVRRGGHSSVNGLGACCIPSRSAAWTCCRRSASLMAGGRQTGGFAVGGVARELYWGRQRRRGGARAGASAWLPWWAVSRLFGVVVVVDVGLVGDVGSGGCRRGGFERVARQNRPACQLSSVGATCCWPSALWGVSVHCAVTSHLMEPPRLPSLVVALRPAGQGPCHLWRCHDILDGSSAGSWKLGGSSTTQTPHSPQRMLLAPQRRRSLARSLTGVETPTAGPPGHLPSRAPGAARAATCPLQGSLTTHVPKSPSPPFFITTTTTTRPSTDDPQIFPPPDRGLFLSVLISPTTALSEHRFIYHRLPYPSATYLSIPAPTIAPHRDPHAPKHIHIYSEAKRNLPRFCFLTVLSTTASVSNPRSAQAASTHTSHNGTSLAVQLLPLRRWGNVAGGTSLGEPPLPPACVVRALLPPSLRWNADRPPFIPNATGANTRATPPQRQVRQGAGGQDGQVGGAGQEAHQGGAQGAHLHVLDR